MSHPQPSARVSTGMGGCAGKAAGRCSASCAVDADAAALSGAGKAAVITAGIPGGAGFRRSGFRGDDKLPHPQQQKRRQARKKDRTSHMLHRASSLLPKNEICPLHE